MKLLLDTHIVLWWLDDEPRLSAAARRAISDPSNQVLLSAVVVWEIRIKEAIGKLALPENFTSALEEEDFLHLPITTKHAHALAKLPMLHRDPFDRMLICQAQEEGASLITADSAMGRYDVELLW